MHRRWSVFALIGIATFSAACRRIDMEKVRRENAPKTTSGSIDTAASAAAPETSSTADVAPPSPREAPDYGKTSQRPAVPSWALDTPQPAAPSALFARGLTGPIKDTFEGLLACQITVSGSNWDPIVPFIGSAASGLPDIRAEHGGVAVFLGVDTPSGTAVFPKVTITKDSRLTIKLNDADIGFQNDFIDEISLDASRGFPLEVKNPRVTLACRGVPRAALAADIKAREAALERALVAMEKSAATIDLARPQTSRTGIDVAQKAALELGAYVGMDDANVWSAVMRIATVESTQGSRYVEAIDAEIAKHPESEFQSLPSGRVRCHPEKGGVVEVEVGGRALVYDWWAKNLGPLQFRFLSRTGVESPPLFDTLFVDDQKVEDLHARIPAKGKVDVEMRGFSIDASGSTSYAIVVREGAKRVFLCKFVTR